MKCVCLKTPEVKELYYRKRWMMDPETMSYNAGYDMEMNGYDQMAGTIYKTDEQLREWYEKWKKSPNRYFEEKGARALADWFPEERIDAVRLFRKAGFLPTEIRRKELVFGQEKEAVKYLLTKEQYEQRKLESGDEENLYKDF